LTRLRESMAFLKGRIDTALFLSLAVSVNDRLSTLIDSISQILHQSRILCKNR